MKWKPSEILFNLIEVSDTGLIKNAVNGKILKSFKHKKNGYLYISFLAFNKQYCKRVHRLIASAHIPNPNNYTDVNHINGIKTDNRVENLEWCTRRYNINHYKTVGIVNKRNSGNRKPYKGSVEYSVGYKRKILK